MLAVGTGKDLFAEFSKLDHIFLEDLQRAEVSAVGLSNVLGFSNFHVFDHAAQSGHVDPAPQRNSEGIWPLLKGSL